MKARLALMAAGILACAAGIVFATIPDATGVIHACYGNDGHLRVIDDSRDTCKPHEKTLTWQQGSTGITGYVGVVSEAHPVPPHSRAEGSVNCPEGLNVLGGGAREEFALGELVLTAVVYAPLATPTQVQAAMRNDTDDERSFFVEAICGKVSP
jgi:hypothetical protein